MAYPDTLGVASHNTTSQLGTSNKPKQKRPANLAGMKKFGAAPGFHRLTPVRPNAKWPGELPSAPSQMPAAPPRMEWEDRGPLLGGDPHTAEVERLTRDAVAAGRRQGMWNAGINPNRVTPPAAPMPPIPASPPPPATPQMRMEGGIAGGWNLPVNPLSDDDRAMQETLLERLRNYGQQRTDSQVNAMQSQTAKRQQFLDASRAQAAERAQQLGMPVKPNATMRDLQQEMRQMAVSRNAMRDAAARRQRLDARKQVPQINPMFAQMQRNPMLALQLMKMQNDANIANRSIGVREQGLAAQLQQDQMQHEQRMQAMDLGRQPTPMEVLGAQQQITENLRSQFPNAPQSQLNDMASQQVQQVLGGGGGRMAAGDIRPPTATGDATSMPVWAHGLTPDEIVSRGTNEMWPDAAINGLLRRVTGEETANVANPYGYSSVGDMPGRFGVFLKGLLPAMLGDTSTWGEGMAERDEKTRPGYVRPDSEFRVRTPQQRYWAMYGR